MFFCLGTPLGTPQTGWARLRRTAPHALTDGRVYPSVFSPQRPWLPAAFSGFSGSGCPGGAQRGDAVPKVSCCSKGTLATGCWRNRSGRTTLRLDQTSAGEPLEGLPDRLGELAVPCLVPDRPVLNRGGPDPGGDVELDVPAALPACGEDRVVPYWDRRPGRRLILLGWHLAGRDGGSGGGATHAHLPVPMRPRNGAATRHGAEALSSPEPPSWQRSGRKKHRAWHP